jgi:hypothetical protein
MFVDESETTGGSYLDGPLGNFGLGDRATQILDRLTDGGYSQSVNDALIAYPDAMAMAASVGSVTTQLGMDAAGEAALAGAVGLWRRGVQYADGIHPWKNLARVPGMEKHHLIEQRFTRQMEQRARDMLSVHLSPGDHQAFTNEWRREIPYDTPWNIIQKGKLRTGTATRPQIEEVARQIYVNHPEYLRALGLEE